MTLVLRAGLPMSLSFVAANILKNLCCWQSDNAFRRGFAPGVGTSADAWSFYIYFKRRQPELDLHS